MRSGWVADRTYGWDGRERRGEYSHQRCFVAYWHFVAWHCLSLGLHVSVQQPNLEIHLPFGFLRIGWMTPLGYPQGPAWHQRLRHWWWVRRNLPRRL